MSWLLFICVVAVSQGKGLEFFNNALAFWATLCRPLRRAVCSALCTHGSAVSAVIRLDTFTGKAKAAGFTWTHLFPPSCWYTSNSGVKFDLIKRCLRTVRDYSGGVSMSGLGFCLTQTSAIRLCGVSFLEITCRQNSQPPVAFVLKRFCPSTA